MKNNMCLNCRDCLHFKACYEMAAANEAEEFNTLFANTCEDFTDRSEWVHLPDDEYTFTVRGDIAKGLIVANCRAAEKALEAKKRFNNRYEALNKLQESQK